QGRLEAAKPWDEDYGELKLREGALLEQHAEEWLAPVSPWLHPSFDPERDPYDHPVFRRGFVETVLVDLERFLAHPNGIFAVAPITGLIFWVRGGNDDAGSLLRVLHCPALGRVSRLRFLSSDSRVCSAR